MKKILVVICFLTFNLSAYAKHYYRKKEYQTAWCKANSGILEYVNPDLSRIDCLTNEFVIEFDFANKWAEAIGQSLYYSLLTNKCSGVVLISKNSKKDKIYIQRLKTAAKAYNIHVWIITPSYISKHSFDI